MSIWNKAAFILAIMAFVLAVFGNEFLPRDGLFWSTWKLLIFGPIVTAVGLLAISIPLDLMRRKEREPETVFTSFSQLVVMGAFVGFLLAVTVVPALNKVLDESDSVLRDARCVEFRRAGRVTHVQLLFVDEPKARKIRLGIENRVPLDAEFAAGDTVQVNMSRGGLGLPRVTSIDVAK
jgi:hypothetical protein